MLNLIGNNCLSALLLKKLNLPFINPFIWMVCPYDSIFYLMNNYNKINWNNYEFSKSNIKKNTFIITIDNKINLHFVHHIFDPAIKVPKIEKDNEWQGEIRYCKIWELINNNYLKRIERIKTASVPIFLIYDEIYPIKNVHTIKDLAYNDSNFKRIIITTDKTLVRNDNICKIIHIDYRKDMNLLLNEKMNDIVSFMQ